MPKLKTKSGAKKRFKITGTGKVVYAQRGKRHGMIKRTTKQIRNLRGTSILFKTDGDNVKKYLPAERLSPFPGDLNDVTRQKGRNRPTPSTRRFSKPPRASSAAARTRSAPPRPRSTSRCNTPTATARTASASSALCGSSASTRRCASMG